MLGGQRVAASIQRPKGDTRPVCKIGAEGGDGRAELDGDRACVVGQDVRAGARGKLEFVEGDAGSEDDGSGEGEAGELVADQGAVREPVEIQRCYGWGLGEGIQIGCVADVYGLSRMIVNTLNALARMGYADGWAQHV